MCIRRGIRRGNGWTVPVTIALIALTIWHPAQDFTVGRRPQTSGHGTEQSFDSQQQHEQQQQFQRQHHHPLRAPPVSGHLQTALVASLLGLLIGLMPVMSANAAMTAEEIKEWAKSNTKGMQMDKETVRRYEEENPWLKDPVRKKGSPIIQKSGQDCTTITDVNKRGKCERLNKTRALEESISVEDGWKVKLYV